MTEKQEELYKTYQNKLKYRKYPTLSINKFKKINSIILNDNQLVFLVLKDIGKCLKMDEEFESNHYFRHNWYVSNDGADFRSTMIDTVKGIYQGKSISF